MYICRGYFGASIMVSPDDPECLIEPIPVFEGYLILPGFFLCNSESFISSLFSWHRFSWCHLPGFVCLCITALCVMMWKWPWLGFPMTPVAMPFTTMLICPDIMRPVQAGRAPVAPQPILKRRGRCVETVVTQKSIT